MVIYNEKSQNACTHTYIVYLHIIEIAIELEYTHTHNAYVCIYKE
jgi:hypothetical protein